MSQQDTDVLFSRQQREPETTKAPSGGLPEGASIVYLCGFRSDQEAASISRDTVKIYGFSGAWSADSLVLGDKKFMMFI